MNPPFKSFVENASQVIELITLHEEKNSGKASHHSFEILTKSCVVLMVACWEAQEAISKANVEEVADELRTAAETAREVGGEYQEACDNQREYFPDSEVAEENEERANNLEEWASELESAADDVESTISEIEELNSEKGNLETELEGLEDETRTSEISDRVGEIETEIEDKGQEALDSASTASDSCPD